MAQPVSDVIAFVRDTRFADLPPRVVADARRGLLDTLGVAVAASQTRLSRIIRDHAAAHFAAAPGGPNAVLWQDGRRVSPVGAALANAMTTDALDAHDGAKPTKGHVGCGVVAATLALSEDCAGAELLTRIAIGYEIGTRAGIALHATASDYHTSGAWIALACAALTGRATGLDAARIREAMGTAEYHGPRSQMMRCIDHPTMVKDGSGWGAMAGVSAGYLAADGFTGAPALTVEAPEVAHLWSDLGQRWYISEQYIKLYPVCRWAQPAVEAVLGLLRDHAVPKEAVAHVHVETFHEASRLTAIPTTTEEAQYSLPFSVAAAIRRGTIGVAEVSPDGFGAPDIVALARATRITERVDFNDRFPAQRLAVAHLHLKDGRVLSSDVTQARGDPEAPLDADAMAAKFDRLATPVLGAVRTAALRAAVENLAAAGRGAALIDLMALGQDAPVGDLQAAH